MLHVPVVPSNYDKLFYIIENNNGWDSRVHANVKVNNCTVERFKTTY